jgi:hypothetical protein
MEEGTDCMIDVGVDEEGDDVTGEGEVVFWERGQFEIDEKIADIDAR